MKNAISQPRYHRRLRFEPLESRRVLSITVDTLVDENNGVGVGAGTSLKEAIAAAVSGDTIDFSLTGTIVTTGLLVNKNLTINGPGANLLTIQAFDLTPETKTGN
jgi:putative extracellular protein